MAKMVMWQTRANRQDPNQQEYFSSSFLVMAQAEAKHQKNSYSSRQQDQEADGVAPGVVQFYDVIRLCLSDDDDSVCLIQNAAP
ncbi:hypothetical protein GUJ93_ZPchr0010g10718 [Zizania palustris]|uniref:Uncharacterized protein n=1 Tax=Zizania palustris TaxID=103762 RepID=A0A8J5WGS3_ZIZPA|nr:hypothetical protein GUJ93_ZPchr0010g10718 [Zizania palustris]